ncbi:glycosyltransferase family 4 protein [Marinobacter shengliensis]|uniref:glycosyltransferase family 4 protein n=1 Tax=Marinobacter shengliensis TaxID=1389223 RepID=UPI001107D514|nr:glycosyltransferase family 4 protein [Marinobacter shengliensis]
MDIWFWQLIISPHMANLAKSLTELGHSVTFVIEREMSVDRAAQGWSVPDVGTSKIILAPNQQEAVLLAKAAPSEAIHICQGVRANGVVGPVQKVLKDLGRRQFINMETVDDRGWQGFIKRVVYKRLFRRFSPYLSGVLANGKNTLDWLVERGVPEDKVFPFAYFLPENAANSSCTRQEGSNRYRVLFVGQFIERKRLDLLINAMFRLDSENVELAVVGSGPLDAQLKQFAEVTLPGRVEWIGSLPMDEVRVQMAGADCLVLPSRHDGWGAVVSEALMSGTPAICSDACGSAVVVEASGYGGVFRSGNVDDLADILNAKIHEGRLSEQQTHELAEWARCLSGREGARYLTDILRFTDGVSEPPQPPWTNNCFTKCKN